MAQAIEARVKPAQSPFSSGSAVGQKGKIRMVTVDSNNCVTSKMEGGNLQEALSLYGQRFGEFAKVSTNNHMGKFTFAWGEDEEEEVSTEASEVASDDIRQELEATQGKSKNRKDRVVNGVETQYDSD